MTLKLTDRFQDRGTIVGDRMVEIYLNHVLSDYVSATSDPLLKVQDLLEEGRVEEAAAVLDVYQLTLEEV